MEKVQKVFINSTTNGIIFIFETFEVAFTYRSFIFKDESRHGTVLEQFIREFAGGGAGDANLMSKDIAKYAKGAIGDYDIETKHEDATIIYTIESGFGIQHKGE